MAFYANLRSTGTFLYMTNRMDWGHFVDSDGFETTHFNNDLYQLTKNQLDWEQRFGQGHDSLRLA